MLNFLLVTGVTGSIMILLLLVLRRVFRGSVSPRLGYAAWLAAAFCLLLPFRVASPASVMNALPRSRLSRKDSLARTGMGQSTPLNRARGIWERRRRTTARA